MGFLPGRAVEVARADYRGRVVALSIEGQQFSRTLVDAAQCRLATPDMLR